MALCPAAAWRPVPNHSGPMAANLGLVVHVQVGNGGLQGYFSNPNVPPPDRVSAHFWAGKNGQLEQYVDTSLRAWAEADGNATYTSVETEGYPQEPLTSPQLDTLATLYRWGNATHGWPLQLAEAPGQTGFGWHGMGGVAWGNHPDCPGVLRRPQRSTILALVAGTGDDDMTPEQAQMLQDVHDALFKDPKAYGLTPMWSTMSQVGRDTAGIADRVNRMFAQNWQGGDLSWLDKRLASIAALKTAAAKKPAAKKKS